MEDGQLPPGWVSVRLGELGEWGSGGTPSRKNPAYYDGDIPWLKIGDLTDGPVWSAETKITKLGLDNSSAKIVEPGTILIAMYGSIGKLGIAKIRCATNQAIAFCRNHTGLVLGDYLFWSLARYKPTLVALGQGGTQQNISQTLLKRVKIPLPPLNEQRRIAEKIDALFAELDKGEETLREVQTLLARYRQSVLKAAVTGELTADWRTENAHRLEHGQELLERILQTRRETWEGRGKYREPVAPDTSDLPELPEGWVWCSTEQLAEVQTGATPKKGNHLYYSGGKIPWITSTAVNEDIIMNPQDYITDLALQETNVKLFPKGSLIIAMYGEGRTRGMVAELGIEATTNQACAALLVCHLPLSLKGFLKRFYKYNYEAIRILSSGGVQPNLNLGLIRSIPLPLPPEAEQEEINCRLDAELSRVRFVEKLCKLELTRSAALRQSILKEAFAGRLVPQDPNDEPAAELLARIRAKRSA